MAVSTVTIGGWHSISKKLHIVSVLEGKDESRLQFAKKGPE